MFRSKCSILLVLLVLFTTISTNFAQELETANVFTTESSSESNATIPQGSESICGTCAFTYDEKQNIHVLITPCSVPRCFCPFPIIVVPDGDPQPENALMDRRADTNCKSAGQDIFNPRRFRLILAENSLTNITTRLDVSLDSTVEVGESGSTEIRVQSGPGETWQIQLGYKHEPYSGTELESIALPIGTFAKSYSTVYFASGSRVITHYHFDGGGERVFRFEHFELKIKRLY